MEAVVESLDCAHDRLLACVIHVAVPRGTTRRNPGKARLPQPSLIDLSATRVRDSTAAAQSVQQIPLLVGACTGALRPLRSPLASPRFSVRFPRLRLSAWLCRPCTG